MAEIPTTNQTEPERRTFPKIDGLTDARDIEGADNLLYTNRIKTRSGHYIEYNDNEGAEHITLQHRAGSMIQMQPDGSVRIVSQHGKMGIEVNGEGYMKITGAYNIIVDGSASWRVEGDSDWFVGGNMNVNVEGHLAMTAKSMATIIEEKYELTAHTQSTIIADNSVFTAGGYQYFGAEERLRIWSGDDMEIRSEADIDMTSPAVTTIIGESKVDINP